MPSKKKSVRLSRRLNTALSMLPMGNTLIDVGCDHGKLCLAALTEGKVQHVLAIDISEASLAKAKILFGGFGLSVEFICADGLAEVNLPANKPFSIAILGMGGELIVDILDKGEVVSRAAELIIMQPMGGERELRGWLFENGYAILDENVVYDAGRYYQLLSALYRPEETIPYCDEALLEFGALCYAKRQNALRDLLERVYISRSRRMEHAKNNSKTPESLEKELNGVIRLLEHWEEKE